MCPLEENARWSPEDVETFCKLCIEQMEKGNCPASNKEDGWTVIINKFEEPRGKKYDGTQMNSKWNNHKEEWRNWKQLLYKKTGVGWDPRKKTIDASDKWWERKIKVFITSLVAFSSSSYSMMCRIQLSSCVVNPKLKPFRGKSIYPDLKVLLDGMFRDTLATGDVTRHSAQGLSTNGDVEATQLDSSDGTRSSYENLECKIDEKIVEASQGKSRKRVAQSKFRQTRENKKKLIGAAKLTRQLCSAVESRNSRISQPKVRFCLVYKELIELLETIFEIEQDNELYFFALDLFKESNDNRQIFMSLRSNERRVVWLKYEGDN